MWSRIKHFAIPISIKLTILHVVILSFILLLTSLLTVTGLYYVFYIQASDDITVSENSIMNYLSSGNLIDQSLLKNNLLVPGITLKIFGDQNRLFIDSEPYPVGNEALLITEGDSISIPHFISRKRKALQIIHWNHKYFYHDSQIVWQNGRRYQFHFIKPLSEQSHFLKNLIKSLMVTNFIGLIIAIISGIFISRKILRPIRDITNTAKEIEINDLGKRIHLKHTHDELHELAKTFNHMLNRLQIGFEQQRQFVSDASHELRTPITVISGYADMLDRWGKQDPAALDEGIAAIKSEAANMDGLIEKLLFLARADQNRQIINRAPVKTELLIDEIIQETRLIAPNHHIILYRNDPAVIYADYASIKEMLRIFIENSIKYTPSGGTISLDSQKMKGQLTIKVQDTGIGIPQEEQTKIFDRFYRVDRSRSKVTGGTGLGLSIARWIAEQHNSLLQLASTPGKGTIITITIPLMADKQNAPRST